MLTPKNKLWQFSTWILFWSVTYSVPFPKNVPFLFPVLIHSLATLILQMGDPDHNFKRHMRDNLGRSWPEAKPHGFLGQAVVFQGISLPLFCPLTSMSQAFLPLKASSFQHPGSQPLPKLSSSLPSPIHIWSWWTSFCKAAGGGKPHNTNCRRSSRLFLGSLPSPTEAILPQLRSSHRPTSRSREDCLLLPCNRTQVSHLTFLNSSFTLSWVTNTDCQQLSPMAMYVQALTGKTDANLSGSPGRARSTSQ